MFSELDRAKHTSSLFLHLNIPGNCRVLFCRKEFNCRTALEEGVLIDQRRPSSLLQCKASGL